MRVISSVLALCLSACALHSNGGDAGSGGASGSSGSGGASGTSGSGGSSGTSGSGGVGGASGASGSGGSAGVGGEVACPSLAPLAGGACEGTGQCVIEGSGFPGCRTVWECFESRWVLVFDGGCVGPSIDLCPLTPEAAEGSACLDFACVYDDAIVCACEQPCSGIQPDPALLRTVCTSAPQAVCVEPKEPGAACAPIGQTCAPACCGQGWTCTEAGWSAFDVFCPP